MNNYESTLLNQLIREIKDNLKKITQFNGLLENGFIGVNIPIEEFSIYKNAPILEMKVYPIIERENIEADSPLGIILKSKRKLTDFFLYKNLIDSTKINNADIFKVTLDEKVKWDKKGKYYELNEQKRLTIKISNDKITFSPKLTTEIKNNNSEIINLSDIAFFGEGTTELIAIPFSFFTTPTFFLVIKYEKALYKNLSELIKQTNLAVRKSIHKYIYQRLIKNTTDLFKAQDKTSFVEKFVIELSKLLLPITYKIGNEDCHTLFEIWKTDSQTNDENEELIFSFKDKDIKEVKDVKFTLKSYKIPHKNKPKWLHKDKPKWLHKNEKHYIPVKKTNIMLIENSFTLLYEQWKSLLSLKKQSNKNALAKVMARNQSHNIGSHVLSRMVEPNDISIKKIMTGAEPKYTPIYKTLKEQVEDEKRKILKKTLTLKNCTALAMSRQEYYNKLIAYFFSYLKTRQDLLADIVSGVPQVQSTKWFKKEIMKGIDDNRLLLNRISGVGDFHYSFNIVFGEGLEKDVQMAISNDIMGQHAFYIILENIIRNTAKHGASKTVKPKSENENGESKNGIFKHIFTICVEESETDSSHYQITIYDDIIIDDTTYLKLERNKEYFPKDISTTLFSKNFDALKRVEIEKICANNNFGKEDSNGEFTKAFLQRAKDNKELEYLGSDKTYNFFKISKIDHLVTTQNIWINKKILDEDTFDLRQQALGLIEMETCTAYLRRIEIDKIEHKDFELEFSKDGIPNLREEIKKGTRKLRLLRAVRPECKKNEIKTKKKHLPHLGYRFYIPKPKELLIIDETGDLWDECKKRGTESNPFSHFKKLESSGILLLNAVGNYNKDWNEYWKFDKGTVYQHSIMLTINKSEVVNENSKAFLPINSINKTEFCKYFKSYFLKEIDSYKKNGIDTQPTFLELLFDNSELLIREVWRAIIFKKYNDKKIKPKKNNDKNNFPNFSESNKNYYFKFLDHGKSYNTEKDEYKLFGHLDIYGSKHSDLKKSIICIENKISNLFKLKYFNATLTNVLVLDERIQAQAYQNKYQLEAGPKLTYAKIWEHCNVIIPKAKKEDNEITNIIDLNRKSFDLEYTQTICDIITERFSTKDENKQQCKGLDFLVIHLGIIEKLMVLMDMNKNDPIEIEKFIKENLLIDNETCKNTQVILISGRTPSSDSLPKNYSFLSYSVLSQYLIENRFKYNLIETLNVARPKIK